MVVSTTSRVLVGVAICALLAQSTVAQDTPREIRLRADQNLSQGNFLEVIPDLEQLIGYYADSQDRKVVMSMELIFYNLGICYFFVGQFSEADTSFKDFLRRYPRSPKVSETAIYLGDIARYQSSFKAAIKIYRNALRAYHYHRGIKAHIYASIARCYLAEDNWTEAMDPLLWGYNYAGDFPTRNWAATLLTTGYLKSGKMEKVYPLTPIILRHDSFASRSVAFNLAALEAGDRLYADEHYREAMWVYRLVYPYDLINVRVEGYLEYLRVRSNRLRTRGRDVRKLMHVQEEIGELEEGLKAMEEIESYDVELFYRLARSYLDIRRFWEGREMFLYLSDIAEETLADESLFLAFQCSTQILPWERAYEIGRQYMERFPQGEYFDMVSLAMGQLYAREEDWPNVITHLTETLRIRPNHEAAAECMFLLGYAHFMEEQFKESRQWMGRLIDKYPESELFVAATYWLSMGHLFDKQYAEGQGGFNRLLEDHPDSIYTEDSAYRTAVCAYGLGRHEETEDRLKVFMNAYPASKLRAEASMMRGDAAGALGYGSRAIAFYQKAMSYDEELLNIELYNHCAFQSGQILTDDEAYEEAVSHYNRYIDRGRDGINVPLAVFNIGKCLWNLGEAEGAMTHYRRAVEQYGQDPGAIGIDMILDEWIARARQSSPEIAQRAWTDLQLAYRRTIGKEDQHTLRLRLLRALIYLPNTTAEKRKSYTDDLVKEANMQHASPAVLSVMLDKAVEQGVFDPQSTFATRIAKHIIARYTESDYALDARMVLARQAIERGANANGRVAANREYGTALRHLGVISEVFAASAQAGEALLVTGDLHHRRQDYAKADEAYQSVLGHREWRNFWPAAVYGRAEAAYAQRQFDKASAYYERIYVMYSHYREWTARAYLKRAKCLRRMNQQEKAREVLSEMLEIEELKGLVETDEAAKLLQGGGSQS